MTGTFSPLTAVPRLPAPATLKGHGSVAVLHQLAPACHADIQIGDLLAQGIAVDPQQIRTFGLIAAGRVQRDLDQRVSTSRRIRL
jgi:hypothetical protein